MRTLVLFMHVSLDGFVATSEGGMDWIHISDEMFDYAGERTDAADTALYGRVTYEMMDAYWPTAADKPDASKHDLQHSRWYNNVQKVVLSRTMKGINKPNTRIIGANALAEIAELKQAAGREIVMFGSPGAAQSLMAENLIDDYWLFVNPVLLGRGIPLFKNLKDRIDLTLVKNHTFKDGVVCLNYKTQRG